MPADTLSEQKIPLVVDMDGTVIRTDIFLLSIARLLRRNPFSIFQMLFWWTRGRAYLKHQLGRRVKVDAATLPYNEKFVAWLREQKASGRKIILATAADIKMALPVANHLGFFDEVMASEGVTNLRSHNKLKALAARYGERGFDYAGNSVVDLAVWRGARKAIVVNASRAVARRASHLAERGEWFLEGYSSLEVPVRFLQELFIQSGYLLAIVAGVLLALAFPKTAVAGFAWIAPALLAFAAHGKSPSDTFRVGYTFGLIFWLTSLYWLLLIPAGGYPILGWISLCAYLALFPATWTWVNGFLHARICGRQTSGDAMLPQSWSRRFVWSVSGAATWVALEMLRGWLLGGFPWSFIGVSQAHMTPLIQIASITGVYGVSFLVVWASLSLLSAVRMVLAKPDSRFGWQAELALPLLLVAGLFAYGEFRMQPQTSSARTLRITLVQPAIPQTLIWDEGSNSNRFEQLLRLTDASLTHDSELLIWPESAVPDLDNSSYARIASLIERHHVWVILNAEDIVPKPDAKNQYDNDYYNAAFLLAPDGKFAGTYHKQALVIFGEYIPLEHMLPFIKYFTPITGSFAAGSKAVQFEGTGFKTSTLICFEDTFPQLGREATANDTDFLVNLTNDGWFGDSAEQWQHQANSIFRAVENDVPLVRCCNNGITCWIDDHGRVREILRDRTGSVYGAGAMTFDLPVSSHVPTFYNRHGNWFGWGCVVWTALVLLLPRKRQR